MDTTQTYKYTIVKAKCNHTGEYIALVPVFHNGFEYTRTYGFTEIELHKNLTDLLTEEIHYYKDNDLELPIDHYIPSIDAANYLPFDELEDGDFYEEISVTIHFVTC